MTELRRGREAADLAEDARQLLQELEQAVPGSAALTGECRPPLDVVDTAAAVEVVVDVPGVPPSSLRVCVRRSTVLVVGAKVSTSVPGQPSGHQPSDVRYHVAERSSGRFARAVRVSGAIDASRAKATVHAGLLRIVLPRIDDRRGRLILVPVEAQP